MEPFEDLKPASRLRYLRELSACLSVAVGDGYLDVNVVPAFTKAAKLKSPKRGKAPFEDVELERLWTELDSARRQGLSLRLPLLLRDGCAPRGADSLSSGRTSTCSTGASASSTSGTSARA